MEICRDAALCAAWARASGVEKILPEEAAGRLELCFFAAGETLCNEGDEAAALQFVLCGRYKLIRLTRAGQECLLRFFDAFSLIGELELLQGGPSRTTAVALEPLVCLRLPCARWRGALLDCNPFLRFLCSYLGYKTEQRSQNLTLMLGARVPQRTASYLLATAQNGLFEENRLHLAEFLGCSHRQLLRALADFCRAGMLRREGRGYRVLDFERLREASGGVYAGAPFRYPGLRAVRTEEFSQPGGGSGESSS